MWRFFRNSRVKIFQHFYFRGIFSTIDFLIACYIQTFCLLFISLFSFRVPPHFNSGVLMRMSQSITNMFPSSEQITVYSADLRRCALLLSFETADWCSERICCNICSRE